MFGRGHPEMLVLAVDRPREMPSGNYGVSAIMQARVRNLHNLSRMHELIYISYEDTWDVICSTNTIFIQDHPLVGGLLRQYTVPDAPILAGLDMHRITSLIMRCDLTLFGSIRDTDEVEQRARFAEYLDLIPRAFPKLTHLQLNLGPETYRGRVAPWDGLDEIEDVLLKPLLEMSNKIKGLRDFTALLPLCLSSLFIFEKAWEESLLAVAAETNPVFIEKVWYPFTAKVEGCEQPGTGYWIGEGLANACGWRPDGTTYSLWLHI